MNWQNLNGALWFGMALFWFARWRVVKRTVQKESIGSRLMHILPTGVVFFAVFSSLLNFGPPFWSDEFCRGVLGCGLTFVGLAWAIWARVSLGKNWSATVTVKEKSSGINSVYLLKFRI